MLRTLSHPLASTLAHHASKPAISRTGTSITPRLANRPIAPPALQRPQRAPYYYAAHRQTSLGITALLGRLDASADSSTLTLINTFMCRLLNSIGPRFSRASNLAHYHALLKTHLNGLDAATIEKLMQALVLAKFDCTETGSDAGPMNPATSTNASDKSRRTLINKAALFGLLGEMAAQCRASEELTAHQTDAGPDYSQAARDTLADCAARWQQHPNRQAALPALLDAAQKIGAALGMSLSPETVDNHVLAWPHSLVQWQGTTLTIDTALAVQLPNVPGESLFAHALRDILELMLMKKMFGAEAELRLLTPARQQLLQSSLERVMLQKISDRATPELRACAARTLAQAAHFGTVQIIPVSGAKLGHAWIAPHLSIAPDLAGSHISAIGTRFMQSGSDLEPRAVLMHDWPAIFLTEAENASCYPADEAIHLTVPVKANVLQASAQGIKAHWQSSDLPYLFMGTAPGMEPTGCRVTVWHAVIQGLDKDARTLFMHFNRGLPDPDSPTELWLRFEGLMAWMQQLTKTQ